MLKVFFHITYSPEVDKYISCGFATDTDGVSTPWLQNEEIIVKSLEGHSRNYQTLEEVKKFMHGHDAFSFKIRCFRPGDISAYTPM